MSQGIPSRPCDCRAFQGERGVDNVQMIDAKFLVRFVSLEGLTVLPVSPSYNTSYCSLNNLRAGSASHTETTPTAKAVARLMGGRIHHEMENPPGPPIIVPSGLVPTPPVEVLSIRARPC